MDRLACMDGGWERPGRRMRRGLFTALLVFTVKGRARHLACIPDASLPLPTSFCRRPRLKPFTGGRPISEREPLRLIVGWLCGGKATEDPHEALEIFVAS